MNPFKNLAIQKDEQTYIEVSNKSKQPHKNTHKQVENSKIILRESTNQNISERLKENTKVRNHRKPRLPKFVEEAHYLDRRSGTGRAEKPRKNGGGRGNIGNLHDQLKRQLYEDGPEEENDETPQNMENQRQPDEEQINHKFTLDYSSFPSLL